jgi:hypothetical protein
LGTSPVMEGSLKSQPVNDRQGRKRPEN